MIRFLTRGIAQLRLLGLLAAVFVGIGSNPSTSAFVPPLAPPLTVLSAFDRPAQPWLAGNRGVDLKATTGESVFAAASGTVLYAGELAGRGVLSIIHGSLRTTYEPIVPVVVAGERVTSGQLVGHVSSAADGCGPPGGCLHWGAISATGYIDPLTLLAPRHARLWPIWRDDPPDLRPG